MPDLSFLELDRNALKPCILNDEIFRVLQEHGWSRFPRHRFVVLTMYEVNPSEFSTILEGDDCEMGIVLSVEQINTNFSQPIGNIFYNKAIDPELIAENLEKYIKDLIKCELFVVATLSNVSVRIKKAIDFLIEKSKCCNVDTDYGPLIYKVSNMEIIHLFDPVSLIEETRDIFFCHDMKCLIDGQKTVARFSEYNKMLRNTRKFDDLVAFLNNSHPNDTYYAIKLFSMLAFRALLQADLESNSTCITGTRTVINMFDLAFDTLNSNQTIPKLTRSVVDYNSFHLEKWPKIVECIKSMQLQQNNNRLDIALRIMMIYLNMSFHQAMLVIKEHIFTVKSSDDFNVVNGNFNTPLGTLNLHTDTDTFDAEKVELITATLTNDGVKKKLLVKRRDWFLLENIENKNGEEDDNTKIIEKIVSENSLCSHLSKMDESKIEDVETYEIDEITYNGKPISTDEDDDTKIIEKIVSENSLGSHLGNLSKMDESKIEDVEMYEIDEITYNGKPISTHEDDDTKIIEKIVSENSLCSHLGNLSKMDESKIEDVEMYEIDEITYNGKPISTVVDNIIETILPEDDAEVFVEHTNDQTYTVEDFERENLITFEKEESHEDSLKTLKSEIENNFSEISENNQELNKKEINDPLEVMMGYYSKILKHELSEEERSLMVECLSFCEGLEINKEEVESNSRDTLLLIATVLSKLSESGMKNKKESIFEKIKGDSKEINNNDFDDQCLFVLRKTAEKKNENPPTSKIPNPFDISPDDNYIIALTSSNVDEITSETKHLTIYKGTNKICDKSKDNSDLLHVNLTDEFLMVFKCTPANPKIEEEEDLDLMTKKESPGVLMKIVEDESEFEVNSGRLLKENGDDCVYVTMKLDIEMNKFLRQPSFYVTNDTKELLKISEKPNENNENNFPKTYAILQITGNYEGPDLNAEILSVRIIKIPVKTKYSPSKWMWSLIHTYDILKYYGEIDIFVSTRFLRKCSLDNYTIPVHLESNMDGVMAELINVNTNISVDSQGKSLMFSLNIEKFIEISMLLSENLQRNEKDVSLRKLMIQKKIRILNDFGRRLLNEDNTFESNNLNSSKIGVPLSIKGWAVSCGGMNLLYQNLVKKRITEVKTENVNLNTTRFLLQAVQQWHNITDSVKPNINTINFIDEGLIVCAFSHEATTILRRNEK